MALPESGRRAAGPPGPLARTPMSQCRLFWLTKGLFPLRLRVALRGVAWREIIETPQRNATRSGNGNTA